MKLYGWMRMEQLSDALSGIETTVPLTFEGRTVGTAIVSEKTIEGQHTLVLTAEVEDDQLGRLLSGESLFGSFSIGGPEGSATDDGQG